MGVGNILISHTNDHNAQCARWLYDSRPFERKPKLMITFKVERRSKFGSTIDGGLLIGGYYTRG